ncbi:hypothetical protein BN7_3059 [Wickerhamomyces ciferrii]|uniref:Uncharacterized protein n=1 Tax=Wickerhamomyces ciferrii (strain ATCC 14091 / BCRC 22168 / CBS 111 / JCM 3599 / NBRC 0793 / NRRL Y-1031 F-60-10) TaxID=1206466 RepID=K0KPZ6_WICCF|nr:uncharacterized protein BN7_3059 [Wickerhamomyces ciferrii]CCH43509.1 hypothetical protein BN7_3059 [Wickerhamomyces ciferrii]
MFSKLKRQFFHKLIADSDSDKGLINILFLSDKELIGTLCLEPGYKEGDIESDVYMNVVSDRFLAALFDPRTSFEFKSNEIFHIVEPQYVEYKRFSVKLRLRNHSTSTFSEKDLNYIRVFLDENKNLEHCFTVLMRPDLNISQILTYLNEIKSLRSDDEIIDYTSKINSERLPKFFILTGNSEMLRIFCKLMNFYSNSIEARTNYTAPLELIGKVVQREKSRYIDIKGAIPHRNCVYFFRSMGSNRVINDENLKRYRHIYEEVDFDKPVGASDHMYLTVYDMKSGTSQINGSNNDQSLEEDPELPKYSRY